MHSNSGRPAGGEDPFQEGSGSILRQPMAVWATAGAAVVAFMGIGLVDPILPSIAKGLDATPSQVSLLFTSYFLITAVAMLVTGFVSSRIGGRRTLLTGLALVVVFAALSGASSSVGQLVGFRAGWGLGNALFVSTSLAVIVGAASGGSAAAILLYESALGLGMACGPLVGAVLGDLNWRFPFFGTAVLMAVGFIAVTVLLKEQPRPARKTSLLDPVRALGHGGLASAAASAFFYNYAFFTVLAFTPFVLDMTPYRSGAVFFGWGVLLAVFSVLVAPALQKRFGSLRVLGGSLVLMAADLLVLGYGGHTTAVVCTILSGALIGMTNTVYTELALGVSDAPRPVASAGYNFVRWFAAAAAPYLAPKIEEWTDVRMPFVVAAAAAGAAALIVLVRRRSLTPEAGEPRPEHGRGDHAARTGAAGAVNAADTAAGADGAGGREDSGAGAGDSGADSGGRDGREWPAAAARPSGTG
ncbi:MFS transporter [Streptomyces lycii]|uniref:MFS transporter n=1 Tax=Streptomyces lycii TaxID=2654337 RepID=UPI001F31F6DF|nr:MFS transporter [Streptomyces lycii]